MCLNINTTLCILYLAQIWLIKTSMSVLQILQMLTDITAFIQMWPSVHEVIFTWKLAQGVGERYFGHDFFLQILNLSTTVNAVMSSSYWVVGWSEKILTTVPALAFTHLWTFVIFWARVIVMKLHQVLIGFLATSESLAKSNQLS